MVANQEVLAAAGGTQPRDSGGDPLGVGIDYDPYPPGILPNDLVPEIQRVRREINFIFQQALGEWRALPPIVHTGQPPTIQGVGYRAIQTLGKLRNFDENMSPFRNRACSFCHMPYAGFGPPIPSVNLTMIAYPGSMAFRAGKRNPQRYTYAPWFPVLELNSTQSLFFGGNFWDSRATGYLVGSPDAEQSQHPPVDTQEHALPDAACIAFPRPSIDLSTRPSGARTRSISASRPTLSRSATPLEGLRCSARTPSLSCYRQRTARAQPRSSLAGRSRWTPTKDQGRSAHSRQNSTPSWRIPKRTR